MKTVPFEFDTAGLHYVDVRQPGISRRWRGKSFAYYHPAGKVVRDKETLNAYLNGRLGRLRKVNNRTTNEGVMSFPFFGRIIRSLHP